MATLAACRRANVARWFKYHMRNRWINSSSTEVQTSNPDESEPEIIVPYKIQRGPTDILEALATTIVKKDYTAPKYKYQDDPYFIPISNVSKRSFALSKESGRKAARYFLENYPDLFKCNKSVPLIKAFEPPVVYDEESDVTEETLKSCIDSLEVTNSVTVYELLQKKDILVSDGVRQSLLELLCFYNSEQPPNEDYCEERWFARRDNKPQMTWKINGPADKLFEEIGKNSAAAYCAMIRGCSKFLYVDKAMSLYYEMCDKDFKGTTETYNSLLSLVPWVKLDADARWELVAHMIQKMNAENIAPNLGTLNAILNVISKSRRWPKARSISLKVLAEMKRLNIEPSLGTYYHVLVIFYINNRGGGGVLPQIVDKIDGQEFTIRHQDDVLFFTTAMEICAVYGLSKSLVYRINSSLEHGRNCNMLGSAFLESMYFRHFFKHLCQVEDFDKFMEVYEKYVPHTYTPETGVMMMIITALDFAMGYRHLPKICSDVMLFEHSERDDVLRELLAITAHSKHEEKEQQQLVDIIWNMVEKLFKRAENTFRRSVQWTALMLSDVMKVFLDGNDLEKAWVIMEKLNSYKELVDSPDKKTLVQFCRASLSAGDFTKVKFCMKYATRAELLDVVEEVEKVAREMLEQEQLPESCRSQVNFIFRTDIHEAEEDDAEIVPEADDDTGEQLLELDNSDHFKK